jgi:hypothetical protein
MRELDRKSRGKRIEIQVGDKIYTIKNSYSQSADELQFVLAEKVYDSIRESDTDICDIASNLGFKADNIKDVKDHIFYNQHDLDRYGPDEIEHERFDASLEQSLAWKRVEAGTHKQDDVTWIKHECAERHHELRYGSGYSEAHERAQSRYDGYNSNTEPECIEYSKPADPYDYRYESMYKSNTDTVNADSIKVPLRMF